MCSYVVYLKINLKLRKKLYFLVLKTFEFKMPFVQGQN